MYGIGRSVFQPIGPISCRRLSKSECILYGFSPENNSSMAVVFLSAWKSDWQNMPPVTSKNSQAPVTPKKGNMFGSVVNAILRMFRASNELGDRRETKKVRHAKNDHKFRSRKALWLRHPMHPAIHGQWWSMRRTQVPQSLQWCERSGRSARHFLHQVTAPGFQPARRRGSSSCSSTSAVSLLQSLARRTIHASHSLLQRVPGSVKLAAR
mmetsp:Transcript_125363/g.250226  ORF Transcript_125363/g.250226 Transcript_125363/m.250226 type:complete len:210 (+) Transcript_125363:193-822(+)